MFDAQMYLGPDSAPLLAALHFFNSKSRTFDEMGFYFVITRIAKMEHGAQIALSDGAADEMDYDLVGDIVKLIPVPIPVDGSFQPTFTPYVEICGTVDSVDNLTCTFCINAHQYVVSLKPSDQPQSQNFQSLVPVECVIPSTPRWKKSLSRKKFIVQPRRYVSVSGSITGRMTKKVGDKQLTECFRVEVDNIMFLRYPIVTSSSTSPGM
ncbi:hypothetical protein DFH29DRAFT_1018665 [Suillus ampliporus]|nr:hypothetical protein DFH29DRAFT_1018665 [Suillus ampliporus]